GEQRLQKDGKDISLTPKLFEVLTVLVKHSKELVGYDELMEAVWGDTFVEDANIRYSIHNLRKALDEDLIETVPKRGYRFNADVKSFSKEEFIARHTQSANEADLIRGDASPQGSTDRLLQQNGQTGVSPGIIFTVAFICMIIGVFSVVWIFPGLFNSDANPPLVVGKTTYDRLTDSGRAYFPALSNDGQKVAYVSHSADNKYSIVLHHLATKSETEILKPQINAPFSLQFSPDGNFLFFATISREKGPAIYRIPIFGGEVKLIFKGQINYFSISPDGEWLAFYHPEPEKRQTNIMMCRSADGSDQRIVSTRKDPSVYSVWGVFPAWSPSGKKLVSTVFTPKDNAGSNNRDEDQSPKRNHLVEVDIETGEEKNIRTPDWYRVAQAIWIDNGKALMALAREKKGDPVQIWRIEYPSGEGQNITEDTNNYRTFRPSSDGSYIIGETWSNSDNLYLFPIAEPSKIRQLTFDSSVRNGVFGLRWMPDGKKLLYVRTNGSGSGNIFILDIDSTETRQLTFDNGSFPNDVEPTPDGKSVVFASNRTGRWHIWQIDLDGDNLKQLTDGHGEIAPEISADGKWLYYVITKGVRHSLWKQPLTGGEAIRVREGVGGINQISPTDSDKIAAYFFDPKERDKPQYQIVVFSENESNEVADLEIPPVHQFGWNSDGTGVYYGDGGESFNNLWLVSTKDKSKTQITDFADLKIWNMDISPDGKTMAVSRGDATGKIFKISGYRNK
ncbi:MAG: hypothetical protein HKN25_11340, partial [Pyrinomonadaceae bacterium]|nr:hypothetical protein [Pyrinomonadaceae bacterium]